MLIPFAGTMKVDVEAVERVFFRQRFENGVESPVGLSEAMKQQQRFRAGSRFIVPELFARNFDRIHLLMVEPKLQNRQPNEDFTWHAIVDDRSAWEDCSFGLKKVQLC